MATGKRAVEQGTYVSPRSLYRDLIKATESDPTNAGIPIIDTQPGPNATIISLPSRQTDINMYGTDARLLLSVFLNALTNATLQLWMRSPITAVTTHEGASSSSSGEPHLPSTTGEWVQVTSKLFTTSSLWVVTDIPPGEYKVLLSAWTGNSSPSFVTLEESHAC